MNLNVRAIFYLTREAAARMVKVKWGRVINIGSALDEAVRVPGISVYAGTKFAVQGFTRRWFRELGGFGITVNNVQPGPIDTELSPAYGPRADAAIQGDTVVVSAASVQAPAGVRYGWADNPTCNLYGATGLPASPFEAQLAK